jgi:hypothetical protein
VYGKLPDDKSSMLKTIDKALDDLQGDTRYREVLERKRNLTRL